MQNTTLLADIEAFIDQHEMAESTFGRGALGDWRLLNEMRGENGRRPRRIWPETEEKIRDFMRNYAATSAAA